MYSVTSFSGPPNTFPGIPGTDCDVCRHIFDNYDLIIVGVQCQNLVSVDLYCVSTVCVSNCVSTVCVSNVIVM